MKLLTPTEIKASKESELARDIARTSTVKDALATATKALNDSNDTFELALAHQQKRWAKEEGEALKRLNDLNYEIEQAQEKLKALRVPIDTEKEIAHNLFIEAETVLQDAKKTQNEAHALKSRNEETEELLADKLDEFSEHETDLEFREKNVLIREEAAEAEREQIRELSKELSIKLSKL